MALLATESEVLWLNIVNGTLGGVVLICCLIFAAAVVHQFRSTRKQRTRNIQALDAEMDNFLGQPDSHAFHVPELGITMADGGEPTDSERKSSDGEKRG